MTSYASAFHFQKLQQDAASGNYLSAIARACLLIRLEERPVLATIDDYGAAASFRQDNEPQIARDAK